MPIALLATGDEIIMGDTLNTNAHQIAHALHTEGLPLGLHLTCSDSESEIQECLNFLALKHDIIIITGGLGPTSDDRTRFALSRFIAEPLIKFPQALIHIQQRLSLGQLSLNPGNEQQALFPAIATLLANPHGTAMGCYCYWQNKLFILLPGPPRECLPMFDEQVLPLLQKTQHADQQLLKWRLFGVAESQIAQQIDEALAHIPCETGYRLEMPYIECKVRCTQESLALVKKIVEPIVMPHIIASTKQKASQALQEMILSKQIIVSIADKVTGGFLQTLIHCPANHELLIFTDQNLGQYHFELSGLKEYWQQHKEHNSRTTVNIVAYHQHHEQAESHELPYRSTLIPHFAAEWLSFRIFHLINKLHQRVA